MEDFILAKIKFKNKNYKTGLVEKSTLKMKPPENKGLFLETDY